MKKLLLPLFIFITMSAVAVTINFDTSLKWNSKVVSAALESSGFISDTDQWGIKQNVHYDVKTTRNRILNDLLERETFSLHDAVDVCVYECNKSDLLRNGQGSSRKKCPELCIDFADNMIKHSNMLYNSNISVKEQDSSFKSLQEKPLNVCYNLISDAVKQNIKYPVLCGGRCNWTGDDTIRITDFEKAKDYIVDDFCDNKLKGKDFYYIITEQGESVDVSDMSENGRMEKLLEVKYKSASDYIKSEKNKAEEKRNAEYEARIAKDQEKYSQRVEQHGDCFHGLKLRGTDCKRLVRKFAQQHACKIHSFSECMNALTDKVEDCYVNVIYHDSSYCGGDRYEYTPTYKDCVATFNEEKCNGAHTEWLESYVDINGYPPESE